MKYVGGKFLLAKTIAKCIQMKTRDKHHAFVAFACAFGAIEWGAFNHGHIHRPNANPYRSAKNRVIVKSKFMQGVDILLGDYKTVPLVGTGIIYADPPYEGTTEYSAKIDHAEKHEIFRQWAADGHAVFVSGFNYEFEGRPFYEILFQKERSTAINSINARNKIRTEVIAYVREK